MNADAIVPNQSPLVDPGTVRLAIVGEAPAVEEVSWRICSQGHGYAGQHWQNRQLVSRDRCLACGSTSWTERPTPFVGESGRLLNDLLKSANLPRERCWIGNVSRRPLREDEKTLAHCQRDLFRLWEGLTAFRPNAVLCLGNLALAAFKGEGHLVSNWRGSIFDGTLEGTSFKCVGAMHPAAILREPSQLALLRHDVGRAVAEAAHPDFDLPERRLDAPTSAVEVLGRLAAIRAARATVGYDIEGTVETGITVCSFATTPNLALSIPFRRMDWSSVWSKDAEAGLLLAIADVLADPHVPKVMHSGAYEMFAHRWLHQHHVRNVEDTMLAWHCIYPELDKALDVIASVLVRGQYWGNSDDWGVYDRPATDADRDLYNGTDSMVTLECWQALQRDMTAPQRSFYEHSRALLDPCHEMSFAGMPYDAAARDALVAHIQQEVFAAQGKLDQLAGIAHPTFEEVADAVCMKVKRKLVVDWPDILTHAKPSMRATL